LQHAFKKWTVPARTRLIKTLLIVASWMFEEVSKGTRNMVVHLP